MKLLRPTLNYIHTAFKLSLFVAMLSVGGFTVLALSPVGVEEYNAYVRERDQQNSEYDRRLALTEGQVAGVVDDRDAALAENLSYSANNLLELGENNYSLRRVGADLMMELEVDPGTKLEVLGLEGFQDDNLELILTGSNPDANAERDQASAAMPIHAGILVGEMRNLTEVDQLQSGNSRSYSYQLRAGSSDIISISNNSVRQLKLTLEIKPGVRPEIRSDINLERLP